jgi:hypothetical protein
MIAIVMIIAVMVGMTEVMVEIIMVPLAMVPEVDMGGVVVTIMGVATLMLITIGDNRRIYYYLHRSFWKDMRISLRVL